MTFTFDGRLIDLYDHPYNVTAANERSIEIPLVMGFLDEHSERPLLEVGNVLAHYGFGDGHDIVDLYERAPGVRNIDVFDVTGAWPVVVSISTVEHISLAVEAIAHMRTLVASGGHLLITAGLGQHPRLDDAIYTGALGADRAVVFARHGDHWVQRHPADHDAWMPYDWTTPTARSVWIGKWGPT